MASSELTVGDVMLRRPKTLPADVSVAEARRALESTSMKMLLLVDGDRFYGAVTTIPDDAKPDTPAIAFTDEAPPTATAESPAVLAVEQLEHRPNGRMVVLDDEERLVGLVCLAKDGETFCGTPSASD